MLASTRVLLADAQTAGYAIGAFNVYNLEAVQAVVAAAESERAPVILQLHPAALDHGGAPLIALCLAAARSATVPIAVHLDHSVSEDVIRMALEVGVRSIMADGSQLNYSDNIIFTRAIVELAHAEDAIVEGELGRLSGAEDGLTIPEYEARLTDPRLAAEFVAQTNIDALAVCIGNAHGPYHRDPQLDFERLIAIRQAVRVPLVLHGASGLPPALVHRAIRLGVCKFNVNTELRHAYLNSLRETLALPMVPEVLTVMQSTTMAMQAVIVDKLSLFGATDRV